MAMSVRSRIGWVIGGVLLGSAVLEVRADDGKQSDAVDWSVKAKEVWTGNCSKCHTAPDPEFETDRGYLSQIMETT